MSPEELVKQAVKSETFAIAYTYNEPLVNMEFVIECCRLSRCAGLKNVIVSNGFIQPDPLHDLIPYLDAANIDVKGDDAFYQRLCGARIAPVLDTVRSLHEAGIHVETTTLLVSGENDGPHQTEPLFKAIGAISPRVPLHISRYFPQYKFTAPPTSRDRLEAVVSTACDYLCYVYAGNTDSNTVTACPECGETLVQRDAGRVLVNMTDKDRCPGCDTACDIVR